MKRFLFLIDFCKSIQHHILYISIERQYNTLSMARGSVELDVVSASTSIDNGSVQQQNVREDAQINSPEPEANMPEFSLPPADSGKQAWMFLAACWAVEALVFGEHLFKQPLLIS